MKLRSEKTAPQNGTMILVACGWPWMVPAWWNGEDWTVVEPGGEIDTERSIHGWVPMPSVPVGVPVGGFAGEGCGTRAEQPA